MASSTRKGARRARRMPWQPGIAVLAATLGTCPCWAANACDATPDFPLRAPVELSTQQQAALRALPPLRVAAGRAPPLSVYDAQRQAYTGISVDVFCFIAGQLGLRYTFIAGLDQPFAEKIQQVQNGQADLLMPLSRLPEREERGLFTAPFYETYYVAIALKGRQLNIARTADLARYRVGSLKKVAIEPILQGIVPADQLRRYDDTATIQALYQALRDGEIDVAVHNKQFFAEERYRYELFDLEAVYTLRDHPRAYGFYATRSPQHQNLIDAFDRYLAVMDIRPAIVAHEVGERQLIERYVAQRNQRTLLLAAMAAATVLALAAILALRRYRRLTRQLTSSNLQIRLQQDKLQQANQELERLSQTDALTRLANRRQFDQSLARELARHQRTGSPLSLIILDADHFKKVNDHYGHNTGDDYLRALAQVLAQTAARPTDLAARYGGEEFACLLPDTAAPSAQALAERLRQAIAALGLPNASATPPQFTASLGVVTLNQAPCTAEQLLAQADVQLYAAKHAGRNRVSATVLGADAPAPPTPLLKTPE